MDLEEWTRWRRTHYHDGTPRPEGGPQTLLDWLLSTPSGAQAVRQADLEYALIKQGHVEGNKVVNPWTPNRQPHAMTADCEHVHCAFHGVDEQPSHSKTAICCSECWHLYPNARALRRAFRREVVDLVHTNWLRKLWLKARVRVKHVYFCPYCLHDF